MSVEIELKLRFPATAARSVGAHPALLAGDGARHRRKLLTIYFDTPDFALWQAGIALRVRREGGRWLQSLKFGGQASGGLHRREELETPLSSAAPDLPAIAERALRKKVMRLAAGRLKAVFRSEFWREARLLQPLPGLLVEAAIDRGKLIAGDRTEPLCELELELKAGDAAGLFALAQALAQDLPLSPDDRSKAERGYRLAGAPARKETADARLTKDTAADEALASFIAASLGKLGAEREALLPAYDLEALHQARVALRRLRTAIALQWRGLGLARDAALSRELSWLGEQLGNARDWDIFCSGVALAHAQPKALRAAQQLRDDARRRALDALQSARYTRLTLDLVARLALPLQARAASTLTLQKLARRLLQHRYRRTLRTGEALHAADPSSRHQLRIAIKRLRYASDFLAPVFAGKTARFTRALTVLQEILGAMNDRAVAVRLHEVLANSLGTAAPSDEGEPPAAELAALVDAWRKFSRTKTFW